MHRLLISCFSFVSILTAQETVWAPKAKKLAPYTAPHRPHVRLIELKQRNAGKKAWTEPVMDDEHLRAQYIADAPGTRTPVRFHPDTREWWYVLDGSVRFEIEAQQPFVAGKGWMVQVPAQTKYSFETVGEAPSLRLEVNVAGAKTLYPDAPTPPPSVPGFDWVQVRMPRKPVSYDKVNQPYRTFEDLAAAAKYDHRGLFVQPVVADDRGAMNFIYGHEKNMAPLDEKDVGHYHPECAEAWLIAKGRMRYPIEGHGLVIAEEGDFVYVPKFRWHAPRFHGEGPSCRISLNGFPRISHLGAH